MEKIIQYAVVNNGQTQLITQLLKSVPVLCQYNPADQSNLPLLENVLLTWLNKPNMTETHRRNLMALLVAAMQEAPFLISPKCCLEQLVVPQLSSVEIDPTFALQVFHKVLQCSPSSILDSGCCDPLAIVVCLCGMIEQCSCSLWDPADTGNRTVLKQCCLDILQDMANVLQNHKFVELDVEWLCEQLCNIGWQARLQAEPVLRAITADTLPKMKYQLKVYPKVISSICHLPADEWSAVDVTTDEEVEVSLLKLCANSNTLTSAVLEGMDCNTVMSYQCLLSAAIQVLPNCLMSEWSNIVCLVGHLVRADQVHVQFQTHYMTHLPLVDLTGLKYELSLLQFTSDVMCLWQTLYGFMLQEKNGEGFWFHLNQCCANTLKSVFSSLSHPATSQAFLLSQAVCHVCHLLSILPALGTESMFVLVLDWLSELQADSVLKYTLLYRETIEESIRLIQNEQWSQTLLKKLL
ncbi:uncharacterized protein LOC106162859 [Lingula anatina]|uniref:Uncharacterized protein LOC106162859 n=1 Tax=Lingula anatina TaxID=7574 RepID=A0A1S3IE62_LINAN|nr:uncharacterized protein LOC106162859 [Lingula anatina]|eukprot:XP_013395744.1 uncharacterized protein LOC106162859 [Lingula anatina]